ncbi:MAG: twin-arginine translocation signal domain-containing protein, partial [Hymenobacter sp.]
MSEHPDDASRRNFLKQGATAAAAFMIVPRFVLGGKGYTAPSDQLVVAGIGVGGKGQSDLANFAKSGKARIAYLCDVDDVRATKSRQAFPQAGYYKDWRKMLDKEHKHF